jgi:hypothetical protein
MKTFTPTPGFLKKNQESAKIKAFKTVQRRATESKRGGKIRGGAPSIELFQREDCAASHSVRNRLTRLGLDFVAHSVPVGNALKHEQLVQMGGKDEVPFLIDHVSGVKLYGRSAIVSYLNKTYGAPLLAPSTRLSGLVSQLTTRIDSTLRSRADQIAWTLRAPLHLIEDVRGTVIHNYKDAFDTLAGSVRFVRETVAKTLKETQGSAKAHEEGGEIQPEVRQAA